MTLVSRQDPFLASKLGAGSRGVPVVDRPRLGELLGAAAGARLVLVSAPAGFGKTTLLATWLAESGVRAAWLSLDRRDNDVVRFSRYLAAATARLTPQGEEAADFDAADVFDADLALAGILGPIAAACEASAVGVVVVLDDYHLVEAAAVHSLVAALVERLPARARLAIATRADPPLPLARLRARGELLEVRADDLRFTETEADELVRSTGVELLPAEVGTLLERTEGWAAALRLAALSLRGRPDHAAFVQRFGASHRYVLDYVVEEVLDGLPADTQAFLLRTSILDRLSGPLCDAITGGTDGQARLEGLERLNLLGAPLDDERRWYRYHALLAGILRARLAVSHPDELPGLHARASAWCERNGDDDGAIAHALQSGDLGLAGRLVAEASGRHVSVGELATVRRWLDALPPEVVRDDAQLSASYAWCLLLAGETEGVADRLGDAERALADGHDGGPVMRLAIPPQLALLRSQLAGQQGDTAAAVAQARVALDLVPDGLPPVARATLRGTAAALLGLALLRAQDPAGAVEAYGQALPDLRAAGNWFAVGRAVGDLARIAIASGDPGRALRLCEFELERGGPGSPAAGNATIWAAMARAHLELGQLDPAGDAARRALDLAVRSGDAPSARSAEATLSRIGLAARGGVFVRHGDVRPVTRSLVEPLTAREVEVLRLVARGRTNRQIADELFVTVGTVKSHVHAISAKLDAANRVEAVARGREAGLLD